MLESNTLLVYPWTTPAKTFLFSLNINKYFRADDFLLQVVCPKLLKKEFEEHLRGEMLQVYKSQYWEGRSKNVSSSTLVEAM